MTCTRQDMLDELSSDWVTEAAELAIKDYRALHLWLQPIFVNIIDETYPNDDDLADFYCQQLGVEP